MASVNKVIIVGNLGNDPEIRRFDNGGIIATISVATTEKWTDKQTGKPKQNTEWHRITFNNRLAEIVEQYLRKGSSVYVEGSIHTRKWTDNNGQDRYSTEIRANSMQMLGSRGGDTQGDTQDEPQSPPTYQRQGQAQPQAQQQRYTQTKPMVAQQKAQAQTGNQASDDDMPF